ncbi:outer membrane receptor for ferrienterochelin and colicin [Caulobacter sp. AP07]|uniref:outer membrane beta-barrel family protein n=1 Tax=Caulobacter sp. AP07 TaxID=1144304 RepID=UPI000271E8EA|nr:outer membrane beta-barrel family protein [Caulobacter sp. AP07]EJL28256.1 outer membrane receptor for ferrienterochelin and colicin [Caulobacter sp. AP07]
MRLKVSLLAAAAVLLPSTLALAEAPVAKPAPKPGESATAVESVTVTSDANALRTSIDRRSYSVGNDLMAKTGSISDALRNIPSVEVDVQGNVSLRGDPNVTILIDGKPSGMFAGEGRGDALQQMPADQIDRVEVMTNPSAAYRPDGSAGIINLITKKTHKPGATGSVKLNVGPDGRYNTGVTGNLVKGKATVSGEASYRFDRQAMRLLDERASVSPSIGGSQVRQDSRFENEGGAVNLRGGIDYDLTKTDRISGEVRYRGMDYDIGGDELYEEFGFPPGIQGPSHRRASTAKMDRDNGAVSADWRHQFKGAEHELTAHLEYEVTDFKRGVDALVVSEPGGGRRDEHSFFGADQDRTNLKVDYSRPLGEAKLKTGLDLERSSTDYDTRSGLLSDTASSAGLFVYDQDVYAGYVTYERPFGDFTAQAGLRLEQVNITTNPVWTRYNAGGGLVLTQTGTPHRNDYFRAYPTLHLGYALSDTQTLTANYSRRVQRPQVQDLNPNLVYIDQYNLRAGNPDLKPQVTDAYELGWQYRKGPTSYLATAYFRDSADVVTDVVEDWGGGVLLTTRENLGKSRNGGLELVTNGKLTPKLSYNLSANAFWNQIDAGNLGFVGKRSGTTLSGRANLSWQATPKDFFQLNGFTSGKRLTPQGHREPISLVNLGYRRKVTDRLNVVVTVNDVADSFRDVAVIDTPLLRERAKRTAKVRAAFFGFTYALGGGKPRPEQFDFGGGNVGG